MIIEKDGRARSRRTQEESLELILEELKNLPPEERAAVRAALADRGYAEVFSNSEDPPPSPAKEQGLDLIAAMRQLEYRWDPVDMRTFVMDPYFLGNTCNTIWPKLLKDLEDLFSPSASYNEAIWTGSIGCGKCLRGDVPVISRDGVRRTIEEWADSGEEFYLASFAYDYGRTWRAGTAKAVRSGSKVCGVLRLKSGRELGLSPDHPVLTPHGWRRADSLPVGSLVATARSLPAPPEPLRLSDQEVKFVAYMLADGCYNGVYCKGNRRFVDEFVGCSRELSTDGSGKPFKEWFERGAWYVYPRGVSRLKRRWGLDPESRITSRDKRVPADIWRLSNDQLAIFLNRLLASDGYLGTNPKRPQVLEFTTASRGLALDVQNLLLRFGIHSWIKYKRARYTHKGEDREADAWRLAVSGRDELRRFFGSVGTLYGREDECSSLCRNLDRLSRSNSNVDVTPMGYEELKRLRADIGGMSRAQWKASAVPKGKRIGRAKLQRMREFLGPLPSWCAWWLDDGIFWDQVEAFVPGEREEPVYDITVPGVGSFVANDLIVHNTFSAAIGCLRIVYLLSCMRDPHRSYGLSPGSNISIVCLSVNEVLATKVVFENLATKVEASPYFQERFPFVRTKKELRFPGNIWVAARASTDGSVLGLNVISGLIDECLHPDSLVLLADGTSRRVEDLCTPFPARIASFDFDRNKAVEADLYVKRSSDQECYGVKLSNGETLPASWNHPVAVRRNGVLEFVLIDDVLIGDEVVVFDGAGHAEEGTEANDRAEKATVGDGSTKDRPEESHVREDPFRRIQEAASREEPNPFLQPLGRDETQDIREQCMEGAEGRLSVSNIRRDEKIRAQEIDSAILHRVLGSPESVGGARRGTARGRPPGGEVPLRSGPSTVPMAGEPPVHAARFQGRAGGRGGGAYRGQAAGVHLQSERESQADRCQDVLRGARLGIQGLGRTLSVASVVSKRYLGVFPTYDVHVPDCGVLVADGVLVHNTNFMPQSVRGDARSNDPRFQHYDHAETLYNAIKRRMQSRFAVAGKLPGMVFVVSSKKTLDDFTQRRIESSANDPEVFVRDYPLWLAKPKGTYSDKTFWVLSGNDQIHSQIVDDPEFLAKLQRELPAGCVLIEVPEDFRVEFVADLEGSIRDIAGIATVSVSPFIQRREKILEAVDPNRRHPFSRESFVQGQGGAFRWEEMVKTVDSSGGRPRYEPLLNPRSPRHIHIDPALRNDACGLCMSHLAGYTDVVRRNNEGGRYIERVPLYIVDVLLRVLAPSDGEIDFGDLRRLIHEFTLHGYSIACVSADSWQTAEMVQHLKKQGYNAMILSVDKTMDPYNNLKTALYEDRVSYYHYEPLLEELRKVQLRWKRTRDAAGRPQPKVDHPTKGSKDLSDALAGCLFTLAQNSSALPLPILPGISTHTDPWMSEQRHAAAAGFEEAATNHDLAGAPQGTHQALLPPVLFGGGGWGEEDDGWFGF